MGHAVGGDKEGRELHVFRGEETERAVEEEVAIGFRENADAGLGGGESREGEGWETKPS